MVHVNKIEIPKFKELGLLRRLALKTITKIQKLLLPCKSQRLTSLYYRLAALHLSVYFSGKYNLQDEIMNSTYLSDKAVDRHARLVVKVLYSDRDPAVKRQIAAATRGAFRKNIILDFNPEV